MRKHHHTDLPLHIFRRMKPSVHLLLSLLLTTLAWAWSGLAQASPALLQLESGIDGYPLGALVEVLEDPHRAIPLAEAMSSRQDRHFTRHRQQDINYGFSLSAYWFRVTLHNDTGREGTWFFEVDDPHIHHLNLNILRENGEQESMLSGGLVPRSQRILQGRTHLFPVRLASKETVTLYLYAHSDLAVFVPMTLWSTEGYFEKSRDETILFILLAGVMLAMSVYNLFIYLSTREMAYLPYVGFILSNLLFVLNLNGYLSLFLLGEMPLISVYLIPLLSFGIIVFGTAFSISLLRPERKTWVYRWMTALQWMALAAFIITLIGGARLGMQLSLVLGFTLMTSMLATGAYESWKGNAIAPYYLLALSVMILGSMMVFLVSFSLLPKHPLLYYGIQIGMALEALLFSFALAHKIRILRQEKDEALQSVITNMERLDKLKDEFLAVTSHELRTPLNGMIGLAEGVLYDPDNQLREDHRRHLDMIVLSAKRLNTLINDILDFSKLRQQDLTLARRCINLHNSVDVVVSLLTPIAKDKGVALVNAVAVDLPDSWADESRLQQILNNLIGNAIKFTHQGSVTITVAIENGMARVSVTDTGIGIPADRLDSIFESYHQGDNSIEREYGGTGLGLAVSQKLVGLHGGMISVSSEVGRGSVFSFTLPLANGQEAAGDDTPVFRADGKLPALPPRPTPDGAAANSVGKVRGDESGMIRSQPRGDGMRGLNLDSPGGGNILVVDDEPINREVLVAQLRSAGYVTFEANNGLEALSRALSFDKPRIDVMLLDVMMPKINGFDVCRVLRQRFSQEDLPILFLTAKGQGDDAVLGLNVGGNDYLSKPFARNELLARLKLHFMLSLGHRLLKEQHEQLEVTHKQLVKQEKLAGLGLLSAGVAHEINNPNNFINLSADSADAAIESLATFINELLDDDDNADLRREFRERFDKINQHLRLVKEGSQRISGIVQGMRSVSRSDADERRCFKPADGLLSTLELVKTTYKHVAEFDTSGVQHDTALVHGYASQVNQVFMNLMVNGCQAIEEKYRKDGRSQDKGLLTLEARVTGDDVLITISDNGCGMPEAIKARLFEPFFTTKGVERGTGLGMGICRGIIDDHQGRIEIQSEAGVGTSITVALPLYRA